MYVYPTAPGLGRDVARKSLIDVPSEDVPDGDLARFVTEVTGQNSVLDDTADPFGEPFLRPHDHVTRARPDDHGHYVRPDHACAGNGTVRINNGGGDCRTLSQPDLAGHAVRQSPCALTGPQPRTRHLRARQRRELRMQFRQKGAVRVTLALMPALFVAAVARASGQLPGQLPDGPLTGLNEHVRVAIDLGLLLKGLQRLREEPFAGHNSAVASQPFHPAPAGQFVHLVGLRLGGVMFPELAPGVRLPGVR